MVVTRLRTPPKRSSISQISKKITNTIYTLIQRSGVRRGLFFTNVREKNKANNSSTIEVLPLEILFNIFEFSSAEKLTKFCLSNQKMMMNVSKYVSSESFARRFSTTAISLGGDETQLVAHFTASGRLIRACLVFRGTQVLIKFVLHFYSKVYKRIEKEYGWTFLFSEALHNATQHEYVEFMRALFDLLGIFGLARRVVEAPIKIPDDELRLRRLLFVHFLDDCEAGSLNLRLRLSAVLRFLCPQKMEYKLLMILGAPIVRDDQDGSEFIDYDSPYIEVINEVEMVKAILGEISELTEELLATKDLQVEELRWSEMQIFNLMETITTYPEPWVLPNFASFLLCSPRLARLAIYTRAIYGSVTEAGYTLFSCVEMAVRLGRDPYLLLHLAAREVSARCTVDICMTMFRESIANAQQRCVDVFNAVTGASDREFVHETMEVTKQISSLIQNMLYLIFEKEQPDDVNKESVRYRGALRDFSNKLPQRPTFRGGRIYNIPRPFSQFDMTDKYRFDSGATSLHTKNGEAGTGFLSARSETTNLSFAPSWMPPPPLPSPIGLHAPMTACCDQIRAVPLGEINKNSFAKNLICEMDTNESDMSMVEMQCDVWTHFIECDKYMDNVKKYNASNIEMLKKQRNESQDITMLWRYADQIRACVQNPEQNTATWKLLKMLCKCEKSLEEFIDRDDFKATLSSDDR